MDAPGSEFFVCRLERNVGNFCGVLSVIVFDSVPFIQSPLVTTKPFLLDVVE